MSRLHRRLAGCLLFLAAFWLGGCGGEEAPDAPNDPPAAPTSDRPTPDALLEGLAVRVTEGGGISDATWTTQVMEVGMALWPDGSEDASAQRAHVSLSHIAGDMAKWLAEGEEARTTWLEQDPTSISIYDAYVAAVGQGVAAYRAWVEGDGRALLEKRRDAILSDGPRSPR